MKPMLLANIDIVEISLYAFFIFFFGLILYLRREDRREGYPLEEDTTGRFEKIEGFLWVSAQKIFKFPDGRKIRKPDGVRDTRPLAAKRLAVWPGAPLVPTGDPMVDGVGPSSYAERAREPDLTLHGEPRIQPMRLLPDFVIAKNDPDPRGMLVLGSDGRSAGSVKDVWIDRMESMIRYIEVALSDGKTVLAPMAMASVNGAKRIIQLDSAAAGQFAKAPTPASDSQITRYEEERIVGYFGGGYLYAAPQRAEPLL